MLGPRRLGLEPLLDGAGEPRLASAVEEWFETEPARPEHVAAGDWLRWEQEKHQALIAAATNTELREAA